MRRLVLSAALFLISACSSEGLPACPPGTTLNSGACRTQCIGDEECTSNEQCTDGLCVPYVGVSDAGMIDVGIVTCTKDQDCPNGPSGPWTDCAFEDRCDTMGLRSRTVRRGSCSPQGLCGIAESTQNMACPRNTDGDTCGDPQIGEWSDCLSPNECTSEGLMSRNVGTPTCLDGQCQLSEGMQQEVCMRDVEGKSCGPGDVPGKWSACSFPDACASSGIRDRTIERHTCTNGRCDPSTDIEIDQQTCVQPTPIDGTNCGNGAQCCSGACTQLNDPANCNVCGLACSQGQACSAIIATDGTPQWACECAEAGECRQGYGPSADCVGIGNFNVCVCQCPGGDCIGECTSGTCHASPGLSYCGY
jgi:hypothetical protein